MINDEDEEIIKQALARCGIEVVGSTADRVERLVAGYMRQQACNEVLGSNHLQYNKVTRKIEVVREGVVVRDFDPPEGWI